MAANVPLSLQPVSLYLNRERLWDKKQRAYGAQQFFPLFQQKQGLFGVKTGVLLLFQKETKSWKHSQKLLFFLFY